MLNLSHSLWWLMWIINRVNVMSLEKVEQIKELVKSPYAWPGGYPLYAVMGDGGCLCKDCVKNNDSLIIENTLNPCAVDWQFVVAYINWESHIICDHCGDSIESAYDVEEEE
jgi:hypothetical protein